MIDQETATTDAAPEPETGPVEDPQTGPAAATVEGAEETDQEPQGDEPDATEGGAIAKVRKEAATYRTKLRDAEAERDAAVGQLEAFQRQAAATAATGTGKLADGADLWRDGSVALDHLIGEDGSLDVAALDQAVARLLVEHPHWRHQQQASVSRRPAEALKAGASSPDGERPTWADALRR